MGKSPSGNHNFVEIPSMDQVEAMDKQRQEAIESLQIVNGMVQCQGKCGQLYPIIKKDDPFKLSSSNLTGRIAQLRSIIKQIERHHIGSTNANKEKEELKQLEEEDKQREILRRLPLYSSKISGYRFLCSNCYDEAYYLSSHNSSSSKK
jgi:hypothetical protein